jgi:hypothetical protein
MKLDPASFLVFVAGLKEVSVKGRKIHVVVLAKENTGEKKKKKKKTSSLFF